MGQWKAFKKSSGTGWKELEHEAGSGWKALLWETWLSGYTYRKKGAINATTAGAQTNFQCKLIVGESSGAAGADVHCVNHCLDFPNDIRFTKEDGETKHDYWVEQIEGTTPNQKATVWIEATTIPASGSVDFYMYYRKTSDSGESNGDNTFIFFDDFPGSSLNLSKWTTASGTPSVSGNILTLNSAIIRTNAQYGDNTILELKHSSPTNALGRCGFGAGTTWSTNGPAGLWFQKYSNGGLYTNKKTGSGNSQIYRGVYDANQDNMTIKRTGVITSIFMMNVTSWNHAVYNLTADYYIVLGSWSSHNQLFSVIRVRKYASPEPTWGSWGSEE